MALLFICFPKMMMMMMMMMMFLFPFSFAQPISVHTYATAPKSFQGNQKAQGACHYRVQIKTSCLSPPITNDYIAIKFGASFYHRVYKQIKGPRRDFQFHNCSSDTFNIQGSCSADENICYLYLGRYGNDGWRPDTVTVQNLNSHNHSSTFAFDSVLPNNIWCGFDRCRISSSRSNDDSSATYDYRDGYHCTA